MTAPLVANAKCLTLTCTVEINAPRRRVWDAMITEIDVWWLPQHRMARDSKMIVLEPRAGGRLYEEATGGGLLWYSVQMISPDESIDLFGALARRFGGPAISILHISLKEQGDQTAITIEDSLIGGFGDELGAQTHAGWAELFGQGLKPYVEGRVK
jgi:uncharacterized protein YndB with AHSA1/START domain